MADYYATPTPRLPGRFDLRQERFREKFNRGVDHPHDLCAVGFNPDELRSVCEKHGLDADLSALDNGEQKAVSNG